MGKRPWWRLYAGTLSFAFFVALFFGYQQSFIRSNAPPRFEELRSETVEILSWQRSHPQLRVRRADGQIRWVEFPTLTMRRAYYWAISFDEQQRLVGATCVMAGRPLKFTDQDRFQVFLLDCGRFGGLSFDKSSHAYMAEYRSRASGFWRFGIYFYLFSVGLAFWAESARNRNLSKGV